FPKMIAQYLNPNKANGIVISSGTTKPIIRIINKFLNLKFLRKSPICIIDNEEMIIDIVAIGKILINLESPNRLDNGILSINKVPHIITDTNKLVQNATSAYFDKSSSSISA